MIPISIHRLLRKPCPFIRLFGAAVVSALVPASSAATLFWNAGGTGGSGNWGTSPGEKNWAPTASAVAADNVTWPESDGPTAVFSDSLGGTITLIDEAALLGIRLESAAYQINAGSLFPSDPSASLHLDVLGDSLSIHSILAGESGITKDGPGILTLQAPNTATGTFHLIGGAVDLEGSLANLHITSAAGTEFLNSSGGLASEAAFSNAGTLLMAADDSIARYTSNGGILLGPGRLTTLSATLHDGSLVSAPLLTQTLFAQGEVRLTADSGSVVATVGTVVESGILTNQTSLLSPQITIREDAVMVNEGDFGAASPGASNTTLLNEGTFITRKTPVFHTYLSNGGHLDVQDQRMLLVNARFNDGSTSTGAAFSATLTATNGQVRIDNQVLGERVEVQSGTLTLGGSLSQREIDIAPEATLVNRNGGLSASAAVVNAGSLELDVDDTISDYISNGGSLDGAGQLTVTGTATLNDGSTVHGHLAAEVLSSDGHVELNGTARATRADVLGGMLVNRGTLEVEALNLVGGSTFVPSGSQAYQLLTTSGSDAALWDGNLRNPTHLAPGGHGTLGRLVVAGDFINSPEGTLHIDLAGETGDMLSVGGTARLGGTLDLSEVGPITPFVPIHVIAADGFAGNFETMRSDVARPIWFNPASGAVMALGDLGPRLQHGAMGLSANQTAVWVSLYDDAIEPGVTNITGDAGGGYVIQGGLGAHERPELLHALAASFTTSGLNPMVLDRLSPEAYAGLHDHAIHATRSMSRSVAGAPAVHALRFGEEPAEVLEVFATLDSFRAPSGAASGPGDYRLSGHGFAGGLRARPRPWLMLGGWLGLHEGDIKGSLMDADASGFVFGVFARGLVHEPSSAELGFGLSYGSFEYDGTRGGLQADATGWRPAGLPFQHVDADALHAHLDFSATAWENESVRLIPTASIVSTWGKRDGFSETPVGPDPLVGLVLDSDSYRASFAEGSLRAEFDLGEQFASHVLGGASIALDRRPHRLDARFANGERPMRLSSDGINRDSVFIGLGTTWRPSPNGVVGVHWRADFRRNGDAEHHVGFGASLSF